MPVGGPAASPTGAITSQPVVVTLRPVGIPIATIRPNDGRQNPLRLVAYVEGGDRLRQQLVGITLELPSLLQQQVVPAPQLLHEAGELEAPISRGRSITAIGPASPQHLLRLAADQVGQLQCLTGLIRIGKTRADAVLPEPRPKRIGRPRRHCRPQPHPSTHHIEGDSVAFQLQSSVLAAEPGVGGGHRTCLTTCLIVVDPCRFA